MGWDGCGGTCRCAYNATPGCPDSFKYYFTVTSATGYPAETSPNGTYNIYVENVVSPIVVTTSTTSVSMNDAVLNDDDIGFLYLDETPITLTDPDDNAYLMGMVLSVASASQEWVTLNISLETAALYRMDAQSENVRTLPNSYITMMGYPDELNAILPYIVLTSSRTTTGSTTLQVKAYKPEPTGMTVETYPQIRSLDEDTQVDLDVETTVVKEVDPEAARAAFMVQLQIFGTIAFGIMTCFCCFMCALTQGIETVCRSFSACCNMKNPFCCAFSWCIKKCVPSFNTQELNYRLELESKDKNGAKIPLMVRAVIGGGKAEARHHNSSMAAGIPSSEGTMRRRAAVEPSPNPRYRGYGYVRYGGDELDEDDDENTL